MVRRNFVPSKMLWEWCGEIICSEEESQKDRVLTASKTIRHHLMFSDLFTMPNVKIFKFLKSPYTKSLRISTKTKVLPGNYDL